MKIKTNAEFGKRECPSCAVVVDANQNYCPICKYAFPHPSTARKFLLPLIALVMIVVLLGVLT